MPLKNIVHFLKFCSLDSYLPFICFQVCLVNDPRVDNPYNKLYTVEYLGNVTDGRPVLYINQPVDQLKKFALAQLQDKKVITPNNYLPYPNFYTHN